MVWVMWWAVVTAVGVGGLIASTNSLRFGRRVAREVREMGSSPDEPTVDRRRLTHLPDPVQRYLTKALGARGRAIRTVRLHHGGTFRPSLQGRWLPIRGEQYFTADPPGFVWWGRVRMFPGVWIDARDRSVNGVGSMFVTAASTFTIADGHGAEFDQGALLRLLAEMTWLPTAFIDERYVQWAAADDRRASATLQVNASAVTGTFEFGPDDLPTTFSADRFYAVSGGTAVLTPFVGRFSDYRVVDGLLIPHRGVAAWIVDGTVSEYARFDVQRVEFDAPAPFRRNVDPVPDTTR
jgi:hypothetical protein